MADFELGEVNINSESMIIEEIGNLPQVKGQLTKAANQTAAAATAAAAGFRTKRVKPGTVLPDGTRAAAGIGGKSPRYIAKKAQQGRAGAVALVVTGNYAAQKDQALHNTMLKNLKGGGA